MDRKITFNHYQALVVDDEQLARAVAKRTLSKMGFDVIEADDGTTALELLRTKNPDIILLDFEMETMHGLQACKAIRNGPSTCNTPIIMMTSHDDAQSIDNAFLAGATDFVAKPVNWTLLKHKIRQVMRGQELVFELSNAERISNIGNWRKPLDESASKFSIGMRALLGLEKSDATDIAEFIHPKDRSLFKHTLSQLKLGETSFLKHRMVGKNQKEIIVEHRIWSRTDYKNEPMGILGTVQDITEKEKVNRRIHQLAYHDELTKLCNRTAVIERLTHLTNRCAETKSTFCFLHIDIDNFKRINDSLGPKTGDILLIAIARRINKIVVQLGRNIPDVYTTTENLHDQSNLNLLARLGADAFAVLLPNSDDESARSVSEELVEELGKPYDIGKRQLTISVSIGVATYPAHGTSAAQLNQNADTAMHSVKRLGKNGFQFYDHSLSDIVQRKMRLEEHLRLALQNEEFSLCYQPQIDITDLQVAGAEALLRWKSAELGQISPADFIPLAEEIGLIVPIGNWVLKTACEQLAQWERNGISLPRLAVNISIRQFNQDNFVDLVSKTITASGVSPSRLELEITESLLAVDVSKAIEKLNALKEFGVDISVDDFGTGYSSLSYLKKFPIDRLKIDQSFVRDIDHDTADIAITKSIIGLARGLSLSVIAEGVETKEHLEKLTELGCDEAQGYLIGKPIPHDEFVEWLKQYENLPKTNDIRKIA